MLSTFIGVGVIRRVSRLLHTTAHVAHQRDLGDRRRRRDPGDRQRLSDPHPLARGRGPLCLDDEHRERVPDHQPHAQMFKTRDGKAAPK